MYEVIIMNNKNTKDMYKISDKRSLDEILEKMKILVLRKFLTAF